MSEGEPRLSLCLGAEANLKPRPIPSDVNIPSDATCHLCPSLTHASLAWEWAVRTSFELFSMKSFPTNTNTLPSLHYHLPYKTCMLHIII